MAWRWMRSRGTVSATSKPVAMWDAKTLATIKTIDVQGGPDGLLGDASMGWVYILSHSAPNVTVLDAKDGSIVGTIGSGGCSGAGGVGW